MPRTMRDLLGYRVMGTDGSVGKVEDFYLDDIRWTVRHIAVRIGHWPLERHVLLSPQVAMQPNPAARRLPVGLTTEEIRLSPDADCDLPVACQKEVELSKYYTRAFAWGGLIPPGAPTALCTGVGFGDQAEEDEPAGDPDLRSLREVIGYRVEGTDGPIGRVCDFLVHLPNWQIERLVVDAGGPLCRRRVKILPDRIRSIQWALRCVRVRMNLQQIQD